MNSRHVIMFVLGVFLHDVKDILVNGMKAAIKKFAGGKPPEFADKTPVLAKLHEELEKLKNSK